MKLSFCTAIAALTLGVAGSALASESKSPIFGSAPTKVMSAGQNKGTIGKGSYADYYGYYGTLYSGYANSYGYYAYGGGGSDYVNNYYLAYAYSSYATSYFQNAYNYAAAGY